MPDRETSETAEGKGSWFTSQREKRLWVWTTLVVATIYATLGLAGSLATSLGDSGLDAVTFVVGSLLVMFATIAFGLSGRPNRAQVFISIGIAAVYVLLLTRLTSPVERSHLIEYGVVALSLR